MNSRAKEIGSVPVPVSHPVVDRAYSCFPFVALAAFWQICAIAVGPDKCPGIDQTLVTMCNSLFHEPIIEAQGGGANGFSPHILATLAGFTSGIACGIGAGFLTTLCMTQFKPLLYLLEPCLEFFRVLPPLLVIPFAIILCGSQHNTLECFTVGIYSAFSMAIYTLNALKNIPPNYKHLARLLGANWLRSTVDVHIPAIMPEVLGAVRVTATISLGIAVVVEYLAAPQGIGRVMKFAISYSRLDLIMVGVVWVVLFALAVDIIIAVVFRSLLKWSRGSS